MLGSSLWLVIGLAMLFLVGCGQDHQRTDSHTPATLPPASVIATDPIPAKPPVVASNTKDPPPAPPASAAVSSEIPISTPTTAEVASRRQCPTDSAVQAEVTLFVLDPYADPGAHGGFHHWRVLGQIPVTDPELRRQIVMAVRGCRPCAVPKQWSSTTQTGVPTLPENFLPDRGLRMVREGRTVEYLISGDGSRVQIYEKGNFTRETATSVDLPKLLDRVLSADCAAESNP